MARMAGGTKVAGFRFEMERVWTHLALALVTVVGCEFALILDPSQILSEPLTLGTGYVALALLALSLIIGPLNLLRQRRNPVNIDLRRDVGIWAGLTTLLHVFFGFQIFEKGQILLYFLSDARGRYLPQLNLFGLSNDVGLLAAVLVFVLLALSNDFSLRRLKGKRWKTIQRWTYPLVALAIIHTLGYQFYNERDRIYFLALGALTVLVALAQGTGALTYVRRRTQTRGPAAAPATRAALYATPESEGLTRRDFLRLGGVAALTGFVTVAAFGVSEEAVTTLLRGRAARAFKDGQPAAGVPQAGAPTAAPPAAALPEAAPPTIAPPDANREPAAPAQAEASPTAAPAAGDGGGVVLATLASCPANSAINFTTPDTGSSGILVHEADGSVKAFSNVCTHRPYPVEYDPNAQQLVCPLHMACFNARTGAVTRGPARAALPAIPVHTDSKGNILYGPAGS
jgi:methionine sulfoxide reductase heme-binding subunit